MYRALLPDRVRVLGADHPDTLVIRNNIAFLIGACGDPREALRLAVVLLSDHERVLGADHRYTLLTRSYIAFWTATCGETSKAL